MITNQNNLKTIHLLSKHNKQQLKNTPCGCFYCKVIFSGNEVNKFIDNTSACCPYCSTDSVLPGIVDSAILEEMNSFYF